VLRCYRIPFSTNVERVALALAHKGLDVEWVDVDPRDRSPVEEVSSQSLVPVLVDGELVVADSTMIMRYLQQIQPEPRLWPADRASRGEVDLFLDWFNRLWKRPPNEIDAELAKRNPDRDRISKLGAELSGSLDVFDDLLDGRDYLFGVFSAADCAAFPFLRYAVDRAEEDDEPFHQILRDYLVLGDHYPNVEAWIERVDQHPRA
jgi:glutathione S-transferase